MTGQAVARRRASSGRLRGLAHLVEVDDDRPVGWRLAPAALCGFRPRRHWSNVDAPAWEDSCARCLAVALEREADDDPEEPEPTEVLCGGPHCAEMVDPERGYCSQACCEQDARCP